MIRSNDADDSDHGEATPGEQTGEVIFAATLTPHRSLGPRGFAVMMAFVGLTCFSAGLMFYNLGAWPVVGFLGLDVFIIWLAFRLNYRAGRACEHVILSRDALTIRRVQPNGRANDIMLNPYWARLEVTEVEDEGISRIQVRTHDKAVAIGTFLNPDDRRSFAHALRTALAEAKTAGM
jgi:uncharacterized membrane protein